MIQKSQKAKQEAAFVMIYTYITYMHAYIQKTPSLTRAQRTYQEAAFVMIYTYITYMHTYRRHSPLHAHTHISRKQQAADEAKDTLKRLEDLEKRLSQTLIA